jgi:hypothetical protein
MSAFGLKRTYPFALQMSAFDPKRTFLKRRRQQSKRRSGSAPQHVLERMDGKTGSHRALRARAGSCSGRRGRPVLQEPVLGAADGERRNGLGVRRVLSEVPEALMSGDATCHFLHPISDRYFEDYVEGDVHRFGTIAVEADEIVAFAKQFDPQTIHTDPEAAKSGPFGGLIASGWHTAAS